MQLLSPRPFQLMHSEEPKRLVHWYVEYANDIIAQECALYPDRFVGVAGLPQTGDSPIHEVLPELERCVKTHGFRGCLINPDPFENNGRRAPAMAVIVTGIHSTKNCASWTSSAISTRQARARRSANLVASLHQ